MGNTCGSIVRAFSIVNGFDGLFNYTKSCACLNDDLAPCDEPSMDCELGYKGPCIPDECAVDGDCGWHITTEKPVDTGGEG